MRIATLLVPHDLTAIGDQALEALLALEVSPVRVHVVHVLARVDPSHPALVWSRDEDAPRRAHALRELRSRLAGGPWARAEVHVADGDPGTRIVELAETLGADLVALPSHGRKGLERLVFGSVAEHVARFAPCPVLVLPAAALGHAHRAPPSDGEVEPDEVVEDVAIRVGALVDEADGLLSALRVGVPAGLDRPRFEEELEARLGERGISFVDVSCTAIAGSRAEVLDARFEPLPLE